jgi:hypothetical protein
MTYALFRFRDIFGLKIHKLLFVCVSQILTWQDWVTPAVIVGIFALLIGLWWVFIRLVRLRDGSPVSEHELLQNDAL